MKWRPVHLIGLILAAAAVVPLIAVSAGVFERGSGDDSPLGSWDAPHSRATPYTVWAAEPDKTMAWIQRPLSDDESAEAVRIAKADASVLTALGGDVDNGKVTDVVLWQATDRLRTGAVVTFVLATPVDFDSAMPEIDMNATDSDANARGYGTAQLRHNVTGLTEFRVFVDLNRGEVVGFSVEEAETQG